ncbi:hypothetical protein ACFWDI_39390 [Streptomyces sp. NPDC060064]|uniref:hypothetical protein n=1 Tax=Streptomyces sp. NPDC060064 TaxID=3347049 RepID=UPI003684C013
MIAKMRYGGWLLALSATALGLVTATAMPASANHDVPWQPKPSAQDLLNDCSSGVGKCTFNDPVIKEAYLSNFHQVSDTIYNCSATRDSTQSKAWADMTGSMDQVGVTITEKVELLEIVEISVQQSYSHTWINQHTETGTTTLTVGPGEVGWINRAQVMQKVTGTWQTHYDDPHWGHYFWEVTGAAVISPAANGTDGKHNTVVTKTRPMTTSEKLSCETMHKNKIVELPKGRSL